MQTVHKMDSGSFSSEGLQRVRIRRTRLRPAVDFHVRKIVEEARRVLTDVGDADYAKTLAASLLKKLSKAVTDVCSVWKQDGHMNARIEGRDRGRDDYSRSLKRIHNRHTTPTEVIHIPRGNRQPVKLRRCGDQRVLHGHRESSPPHIVAQFRPDNRRL